MEILRGECNLLKREAEDQEIKHTVKFVRLNLTIKRVMNLKELEINDLKEEIKNYAEEIKQKSKKIRYLEVFFFFG